jgi:hypothetical protein
MTDAITILLLASAGFFVIAVNSRRLTTMADGKRAKRPLRR